MSVECWTGAETVVDLVSLEATASGFFAVPADFVSTFAESGAAADVPWVRRRAAMPETSPAAHRPAIRKVVGFVTMVC